LNRKAKGRPSGTTACSQYPAARIREQGLRDVRDLSNAIQQELEKFFIATDELEDKTLEIIGWKGPKIATKAIKDGAKSFSRDDK
jgi:inorganic pyrophosphatase